MDLHANAVLTVRQRQRVCDLVGAGVTITAAALVVGCSSRRPPSGSTDDEAAKGCTIARVDLITRQEERPQRLSGRSCMPAPSCAKDRT